MENILVVLEYLLRIIVAGICGAIIGFERKNRGKEAGIKTHIIVALASALMMIVSKYGFNDLAFGEDFKLDPSRVASQIVSGVGFLGAGMIFIQKRTVQGLTTAAGMWATSGIGMAIGCGMYAIGILSSIVILIVQFITHRKWRFLRAPNEEEIELTIVDSKEAIDYLKEFLQNNDIHIVEMKMSKGRKSCLDVNLNVIVNNDFNILNFLDLDREYVIEVNV